MRGFRKFRNPPWRGTPVRLLLMSTLDSPHTLKGHAVPQGTLSSRGPSPPGDLLSPDGDSPCLAAQFTLSRLTAIHLVPQGTLSRLTAIHLVPQGTLSSRGPSLAPQFTLSRLTAIHLVNTSLYARRQHPSAIAPASPPRGLLLVLYLRPSLGSCCRRSRQGMPAIQCSA